MLSIFLNLSRPLWANIWSILEIVPCACKNMHGAVVLHVSGGSSWLNLLSPLFPYLSSNYYCRTVFLPSILLIFAPYTLMVCYYLVNIYSCFSIFIFWRRLAVFGLQ